MPLPGTGMLIIATDIDPLHEIEFNRWYDREHVAERVAIPGFLAARRFVAVRGEPKYLALYETESIGVLDSTPYRETLARQTEWSLRMMARFRNTYRGIARLSASIGIGRGGAVAFFTFRPLPGRDGTFRTRLIDQRLPRLARLDGVVACHLLENDPRLSRPLDAMPAGEATTGGTGPGPEDWNVVVEGTTAAAVAAAADDQLGAAALAEIGMAAPTGAAVYQLLWDLDRAGLASGEAA